MLKPYNCRCGLRSLTWACMVLTLAACSEAPSPAAAAAADVTVDSAVADTPSADVADVTAKETAADIAPDVSANQACCTKANAVCGFVAGCLTSCGGCPVGTECKAGKCAGKLVKKKLGEGCGPDKTCRPPANSAPQAEFNDYFNCLDAQCDSARCYLSVCSKACAMGKDSVNNGDGSPGQDGIEDPGVTGECGGAVAGPAGSEFHCIEQAKIPDVAAGKSSAVCMAGSTFKACKGTSDCDASQACALRYILASYVTVCVAKMQNPSAKPTGAYSESCNGDPVKGEIAYCANNHCSNGGNCLGFCKSDADCVTTMGACQAGKCLGSGTTCQTDVECSAAQCVKDLKYYSNVAKTFDQCRPRKCALDGDCKDNEFYCRNWYNGVQNIDGDPDPADPTKILLPGFDPSCVRKQKGAAKKGEACDPNTNDSDTSIPICANPAACYNGSCGGMCKVDTDCANGQKCGISENSYDLSEPADGDGDVFLPNAICQPMPNAKGPCKTSKECSDPSAPFCRPWEYAISGPAEVTGSTATTYATGGLCISAESSFALPLAECGVSTGGKLCKSGVCLGTNAGKNMGYCGELCSSSADCPAKMLSNGGTYKSVCRSYFRAWGGTAQPEDDLYFPFCGTAYKDSSLADCAATKKCDNAKDYCAALAVAFGPDQPIKMEFKCLSAWTATQTPGTKKIGEACNPNPAANAVPECASGYACRQDAEKGKGYCMGACNVTADCELSKGVTPTDGMMCDTGHMFIPRHDKTKAGIAPLCLKKKACLPCQWDTDCTANYRCTNLGGPYSAANQRCAAPCDADGDCDAVGGGKCVARFGHNGEPLGGGKICKPVCTPL
ncbi:MAG: hypothetical protein EXR77_07085 [Myxococcales bacterium]|nr:hypothetical protein [Myxococcales bacterium]